MSATLLRGGHVIDPERDVDRIADVVIDGGRIAAVGEAAVPAGAEIVDCRGAYVSPGWIDAHVHAYGTLGFAEPDRIGIDQGVTTFVDAGGCGVGTLDEFFATMDGLTTRLYAGVYIRPLGIIGLSFIEDDVRNWIDVPVERWIDTVAAHRERLRYLKIGAFAKYGPGPLKLGKGLAETLGLPLYAHIGEFAGSTGARGSHDIFRIAEAGDMITHLYHGHLGGVLDDDGRVRDVVWDAERRGVLFDIGFGGINFSWDVAERAFAQGLVPALISSDLQQFNVTGPVFSLANVMSVFLRLGLSLRETVARVTAAPARALGLTAAGSLAPGAPADVTVFRTVAGAFELADCEGATRSAETLVEPLFAYAAGVRRACDLLRCQDESNWFVQVAEDHVPAAAAALRPLQRAFLAALRDRLLPLTWRLDDAQRQDIRAADRLQTAFHDARAGAGIGLRDALSALYAAFLDRPFAIQAGLFLLRLDRAFALERLAFLTSSAEVVA